MGFGDSLRKAMERLRNSSSLDRVVVKETIKELQRALISADVEISLVLKLSKSIEEEAFKDTQAGMNRKEHAMKRTHDMLAEMLGGHTEPPEKPSRILLAGLNGNGKTTSAGKLAKWYSKRGLKVGLLAADVYRPAAVEQLRTLAEKTKSDFYGDEKEKDAVKAVKAGLAKLGLCDLIICDSAGRSALDEELSEELIAVDKVFGAGEKWLVIGADVGQVARKQAEAFHDMIGINGVVITRMDGSAKGGGALAACHATGANVYFIGTGENMADLQEFDATRYLARIMGYGDLKALLEKAEEVQAEESLDPESMLEGNFSLGAFYKQMKAARKMGPLGKVMEMMGISQQVPKEFMEMGEQKLDRFGYIIDSMTAKERSDPETLNKSRIARIARGSGSTQEQVRELLRNFKKMKKVFRQFSNMDPEKLGGNGMDIGKMQRMLAKKKKIKIR